MPSAPLSLDTVSRQRPLLMHNFGCEGVGHDDTMFIRGVGCLLYAPPSLQFGVTYPFNRTFLFMSYEGMTARTPDGRWNSRPTVPLKVSIDPERTTVSGPAYLNLSLRPKDSSASAERDVSMEQRPARRNVRRVRRVGVAAGAQLPTGQETGCGRCQ